MVRKLRVNFLHFVAKYFRHQANKTQRMILEKLSFVSLGLCGNFSGLSGLGIEIFFAPIACRTVAFVAFKVKCDKWRIGVGPG